MAYIDQADLSAYLGRALTDAEAAQADTVIDAACAAIDRYLGRGWDPGTVEDELHTVQSPTIRLRRAPVAAVTTVRARPAYLGAAWSTLTAGTHYELVDAENGVVFVSSADGTILEFTYTATDTAPAPVVLAAQVLSAAWLTGSAGVHRAQGIRRYSIGGELSVEYADTVGGGLPPEVTRLLAGYRRLVRFA
jgi:hypothetical protein